MNKKIRILAAALSTLMLLASCGQKPGAESGRTEQSGAGEGKLFTAPTELDLVITSHVSWPYNENWEVWKYFKEATGAEFNIQAIPGADLETKLPLMMASPESLPDLIYMYAKSQVDAHALSGAFVSLDDRMEEMPNYRAFLESLPEETAEELVRQRTSGDGKVYSAPCYGTQTVTNLRTWLYREDIFKKHKLKAPETFEELYQVCKKLKELYPESYPLCFREGLFKLEDIGPSWQSYFSYLPYYDFDAEEWRCGAQEPVMKEIVEYFLKLKKEDLVPPNYTTIETKSWEELMSTDRGCYHLRLCGAHRLLQHAEPADESGVHADDDGAAEAGRGDRKPKAQQDEPGLFGVQHLQYRERGAYKKRGQAGGLDVHGRGAGASELGQGGRDLQGGEGEAHLYPRRGRAAPDPVWVRDIGDLPADERRGV